MLTPGPFALPMTDRQAFALEAIVKQLPAAQPRRLALPTAAAPQPEGRSDISWITTEAPDRQGDIVLAAGMDDAHFKLNPIVTLNHDYTRPPVGRSLWRKLTTEGATTGIKAKTYYPPRPAGWSEGPWLPDLAYGLLQAGLLNAKSIGFLPLKVRAPSADEICRQPALAGVRAIVERWLLLEYACCYLPVQPHAVVTDARAQDQRSVPGDAAQLQHPITRAAISPNPVFTNFSSRLGRAPESSLPQLLAFLGSPSFAQLLRFSLQRTYEKHTGMV